MNRQVVYLSETTVTAQMVKSIPQSFYSLNSHMTHYIKVGKTQSETGKIAVADSKDGKYMLSYTLHKADIYDLTIFVNGESISLKPYQVRPLFLFFLFSNCCFLKR